jgi:hypothetical protein
MAKLLDLATHGDFLIATDKRVVDMTRLTIMGCGSARRAGLQTPRYRHAWSFSGRHARTVQAMRGAVPAGSNIDASTDTLALDWCPV